MKGGRRAGVIYMARGSCRGRVGICYALGCGRRRSAATCEGRAVFDVISPYGLRHLSRVVSRTAVCGRGSTAGSRSALQADGWGGCCRDCGHDPNDGLGLCRLGFWARPA